MLDKTLFIVYNKNIEREVKKMYNKYYTVSYKKYNEPVHHEHFTAEQYEEMVEFVFKLAHDNKTEYLKKVITEELI